VSQFQKEQVLHFYKSIADAIRHRKELVNKVQQTLDQEPSKFNVKIALSFIKQAQAYDEFLFKEFDGLQDTILELIKDDI
jgi:hypothetical protein